MFDQDALEQTVALALTPLAGPLPCGDDLRYDPAIATIRDAREADDPTLPMGDWERPLKRADWPTVAELCTRMLTSRTKDLQLACWLTEAWIHLHGVTGLNAGLSLVTGLLEQFWDGPDGGVHPQIGADLSDVELRLGPLRWLNKTLPLALRLDITLLDLPEHARERLVLDDWERVVTRATRTGNHQADGQPDDTHLPERDELLRLAKTARCRTPLIALARPLAASHDIIRRLDAALDARLGLDAPSLAPLRDALERIERAWTALHGPLPNLQPSSSAPLASAPAQHGVTTDARETEPVQLISLPAMSAMPSAQASQPPMPTHAAAPMDRDEAYRQLATIADFLARVEPHSPTPYIVRRAITWGQMPLPQLLKELLRQEGDLNRLFGLLGVPVD